MPAISISLRKMNLPGMAGGLAGGRGGGGGVFNRVMKTHRVLPEHDERINQQALILIRRLMLV
jgi:hypothetical protein